MAGYIGTQAVSVNTTSATISDDLTVGDDATIAGTLGINTTSPSNDVEIITSADAKGLTIKNAGNVRPYLNFDSNRTGAGNTLSQLNFKWNGADVARINAVAGADTTNKDDGVLVFFTAAAGSPTEAMRIASTGLVTVADGLTLTDGNLVVAAGHGIDFAATSDGAGTDSSELLDDYEEGAWTPTYRQGSNNPAAYATQYGYYTKVGGVVHASGYLTVNGLASMSGTLVISGLPYTIQNLTSGFSSVNIGYYENLNLPTDNTSVMGYADANTVDLNLRIGNNTASSASMTAAQLSADGGMIFSVTYRAA